MNGTALAVAALLGAAPAYADGLVTTPDDAVITAAGAGLWIASEAAKPGLAPDHCRFCEPEVNSVDWAARQALMMTNAKPMAIASDAALYLVMPLTAGLLTLESRTPGTAALLVAQSVVLTSDLNQIVKFGVGRARPYARFGHDVGKDPAAGDDYLSFFSGHAAATFSMASASYAWLRVEKPELAPYAGGLLFAGAAFTGYARIASDRHYLSDVLVGGLVGSGMGWLIIDSHRPRGAAVRFDASPAAVRVSFAF